MPIHAVRMKLKPGMADEYKRRQQKVWPHLSNVLRHVGIYDYSIFLDEETLHLFAVLKLWPDHQLDSLSSHPVMNRWWNYMADLMEVGADNRPREWPLESTFHFA
jgi:L-rhamnose mutarotase